MFDFCRFLMQPLRWTPRVVHARGLSLVLNRVLAQQLGDGELDFLLGKVVSIDVDDLDLRLRVARDDRGFLPAPADSSDDVRFSGNSTALLALLSQHEDADTLFFRRRLKIEGDTVTALHLKNFLDALGEPLLPGPARQALWWVGDLYARLCEGDVHPSPQVMPGRPFQ